MTSGEGHLAEAAFARRVYQQLALSALVAASFAWLTSMSQTIGGWFFDIDLSGRLRLTELGIATAAAPFFVWTLAAAMMDRPRARLGATFFWILSVGFGLAANLLALLLSDASGTSVFYITAVAFSVLGFDARLSGRAPKPLRVFVVFALVTLALAQLFDVVLTQSRTYFLLDVGGGLLVGTMAAGAALRFDAIRHAFEFGASDATVVDYAALNVFLPRFIVGPERRRPAGESATPKPGG